MGLSPKDLGGEDGVGESTNQGKGGKIIEIYGDLFHHFRRERFERHCELWWLRMKSNDCSNGGENAQQFGAK